MPLTAAEFPQHEPTWIHPGPADRRVPVDVAAAFLRELDLRDTEIVVLSYGLGLSVGPVARVLKVDPALVTWRLHDVLARWQEAATDEARDPGSLERTLTELLRDGYEDTPEPLEGAAGWHAGEILARCDEQLLANLEQALRPARPDQIQTAGVGVGLLVLVALVMLGFLAFGVVRDRNPLTRGNDLMRRARFEAAIQAFNKVATTEARTRVVVCLLALGRFEDALAKLGDEDTRAWFGSFAPSSSPLHQESDAQLDSRAQLPRGLITMERPPFVVRAGPAATLTLTPLDGQGGGPLTLPVPARAEGDGDLVQVPFPRDWPTLQAGRYVWEVADADGRTLAAFDMAPRQIVLDVRDRNLRVLGREVPLLSQNFLRGHHFVNAGLYMQAGLQFGRLATQFPDQPYPREQVWAVAEALRVDPAAFLR